MATLSLGLAIADLGIPRAYPCGAYIRHELMCGATPASLYHRTCGTESHGKDIWLCPVHAMMAASGATICHDCAINGGVAQARIYRIVMIPVRIPR